MELQTRLVFIDTSAYETKKLQFGHFALDKLQGLVEEEKIHLLITDIVRSEIEKHLKKYADEAVKELKKFRKAGSFLCVADDVTGGGLFPDVTSEAVHGEAIRKFNALVDNGLTETVTIERVNPKQIFDDYFSSAAPFHREAKKSEFPDAFSLAAVDAVARARTHKVYVVSADGDMAAVAEKNDNFIYLPSIDVLLDLVNRNDDELAELSTFADSILEQLKDTIVANAREKLKNGEYQVVTSTEADPELNDVEISAVKIAELQLIEVTEDSATYDVIFHVDLTAEYTFDDYTHANWDKEDHVYYGVDVFHESFNHNEKYVATLEIGFFEGIRANAEVSSLQFDDVIFELDLDCAKHIVSTGKVDYEPQEPEPF